MSRLELAVTAAATLAILGLLLARGASGGASDHVRTTSLTLGDDASAITFGERLELRSGTRRMVLQPDLVTLGDPGGLVRTARLQQSTLTLAGPGDDGRTSTIDERGVTLSERASVSSRDLRLDERGGGKVLMWPHRVVVESGDHYGVAEGPEVATDGLTLGRSFLSKELRDTPECEGIAFGLYAYTGPLACIGGALEHVFPDDDAAATQPDDFSGL